MTTRGAHRFVDRRDLPSSAVERSWRVLVPEAHPGQDRPSDRPDDDDDATRDERRRARHDDGPRGDGEADEHDGDRHPRRRCCRDSRGLRCSCALPDQARMTIGTRRILAWVDRAAHHPCAEMFFTSRGAQVPSATGSRSCSLAGSPPRDLLGARSRCLTGPPLRCLSGPPRGSGLPRGRGVPSPRSPVDPAAR